MKTIKGERGLVKAIVLIVVALVVLGFLGYNLRDIIASPAVHDNLAYAWGLVVKAFDFVRGIFATIFNK